MTAEILRAFTHEHNRLEVAEQEYELAREGYANASASFNVLDPKSQEAFRSALERRNRAWEVWWDLQRGSSAR